MKTFKPIVPVLLVLLPACQRQDAPAPPALVEHTLYASAAPGEYTPDSRTVLDEANDKKILWNSRESISILSNGGNYPFQGNNESPAASAGFTGLGPEDLGNYIALYPYDASASYSDGYVSTSLPAGQTGRAGSFGDGYLITADDATGNSLSFNHMCSGLRFKVSRNDITSVSIRGNSGEGIAGNFRFRFTSADTPVAEAGDAESVSLTAPGGYFQAGKYYYIVILPTVFTRGFTLTAEGGDQVGELRFDSGVTFSCGAFKNITGNLDERMSWETPSGQVYYGPQNSFCMRKGETISFDVSPRMIDPSWLRTDRPATADAPGSAAVLWGGSSVSSAIVADGKLTVSASNTTGSALVAIQKGNTILWSYLIWVTSSAPEELTLPGGGKILPALGDNLYFQWGRKDPLLSGATRVANHGTDGLPYAIANPADYIRGVSNAYDWFSSNQSSQDGSLWGDDGAKTVWDPCPEGYRVPSEDDFNSLDIDYLLDNFDALGYIADDGWHSGGITYWTRTVHGYSATALDDDYYNHPTTVFYDQSRSVASPVRCIKE